MTTTAPLAGGLRSRSGAGKTRVASYEPSAAAGRLTGALGVVVDLMTRGSALPDAPGERCRARARTLQGAARELCARHGLRARVLGALPEPPFVLVANHLSYLDPLVLAALTPCTAIAKHEIDRWPVVGARTRDLGVLLVDRGCAHSGARALRGALRALRHGVSVLNFPEGTTTRGDLVLSFRSGIFGVARLAGVPIVPAAIAYDAPELCWAGDDLFLPHYLRFLGRRDAGARVALGAPLLAEGSPAELAERARAAILDLLPR
jgi:lyso-ornithine lipid O-acyltransferase